MNHQLPVAPPPFPVPPQSARPPWNGKTNGFSIASLALSLFGCVGLLSVVFGIIGLRRSIRNGDRRGKVYAIAGLIISGLVLTAFAAFVTVAVVREVADGPDRDAAGVVRGERSLRLDDLRAGDCIADVDEQSGARVDVVPCSTPHDTEVFAVYDLPGGPWPGAEPMRQKADAGCEKRFPAYSGRPADPARQVLFPAPPDEFDWPDSRRVLCFAHHRDGTTATSLRR
ncbi:DUF4190 domain-containing protein [Actinoplanes sp. M2I2]|uniref:DUF4190 domain-containing protein n=1 Tax=Actinoplanes sp. M2I2 TaxID=1734444 RepID=UPI002021DF58|nr:DUF4190 domain-containing protein [Actinoplanes sp. M2I2]